MAKFWSAAVLLCLSGFVGCLAAALILKWRGVASPGLLRFMWFMIVADATFAGVAYRIREELNKTGGAYRIREESPERKESPRHQLLNHNKTVVTFLLDPAEPEKMDAKETAAYDQRVATAKSKLRAIIQEDSKSDLAQYECTIGIKILSARTEPSER
jgi:hypothetical protein